ncbi:MAG TPA: HD domain-containing protein [Patescibacteria group bacterium]|nr:HD domain-containing protein [Patescibacteria group bacterium]
MAPNNLRNTVNFIFELNQLKRQKHSGFTLVGVNEPDSVASHVWRAAQIAYILATMENNPSPEKVATMVLIHDNGEARIGDQHKVAARYFNNSEAEATAFSEQLNNLETRIKNKWQQYFNEFENRNTPEGIIAKDADWLETAFQAKEYLDLGYPMVQNWIDNVGKAVETKSAKLIIKEMKKTGFTDWWRGLKKMTYKKLYN